MMMSLALSSEESLSGATPERPASPAVLRAKLIMQAIVACCEETGRLSSDRPGQAASGAISSSSGGRDTADGSPVVWLTFCFLARQRLLQSIWRLPRRGAEWRLP